MCRATCRQQTYNAGGVELFTSHSHNMSTTRILVHIVFTTKHRAETLPIAAKRRLYAYMYGIIKNKKCTTLRINGMSDHVHLLICLNPSISLADLVKDIKVSTSLWIKNQDEFTAFRGWNTGYYAASIGRDGEQRCINYIKNQEAHHSSKTFLQEAQEFAMEYMLDWSENDWM